MRFGGDGHRWFCTHPHGFLHQSRRQYGHEGRVHVISWLVTLGILGAGGLRSIKTVSISSRTRCKTVTDGDQTL